jgi:hypothetical protein
MRKLLVALIAPCALFASGCASLGNFTSIYRESDLESGRSLVMDAQQWAILNIPRQELLRDANGVPVLEDDRPVLVTTSRVVCAMPSPDAISAAAASGRLALDNPGGTSANGGLTISQAAAYVGLRTQSIQLMRDSMYRMCEGFAIGGLDPMEYGIMMRRFQTNMVAILAVEQLTGAISTDPYRVSTSAQAPKEEDPQDPADPADPADPKPSDNRSFADTKGGETGKETAAEQSAEEARQAAQQEDKNRNDNDDAAAAAVIAQSVESITLAAMSSDYNSQMCFETMRYQLITPNSALMQLDQSRLARMASAAQALADVPEEQRPAAIQLLQPLLAETMTEGAARRFNDYCLGIMERDLANRREVDTRIGHLVTALADPQTGSQYEAEQINAIRSLLAQLDQGWTSSDLRDFPATTTSAADR